MNVTLLLYILLLFFIFISCVQNTYGVTLPHGNDELSSNTTISQFTTLISFDDLSIKEAENHTNTTNAIDLHNPSKMNIHSNHTNYDINYQSNTYTPLQNNLTDIVLIETPHNSDLNSDETNVFKKDIDQLSIIPTSNDSYSNVMSDNDYENNLYHPNQLNEIEDDSTTRERSITPSTLSKTQLKAELKAVKSKVKKVKEDLKNAQSDIKYHKDRVSQLKKDRYIHNITRHPSTPLTLLYWILFFILAVTISTLIMYKLMMGAVTGVAQPDIWNSGSNDGLGSREYKEEYYLHELRAHHQHMARLGFPSCGRCTRNSNPNRDMEEQAPLVGLSQNDVYYQAQYTTDNDLETPVNNNDIDVLKQTYLSNSVYGT